MTPPPRPDRGATLFDRLAMSAAVPMARRSGLGDRVRTVLGGPADRRPVRRSAAVAGAVAAAAVLAAAAAITPSIRAAVAASQPATRPAFVGPADAPALRFVTVQEHGGPVVPAWGPDGRYVSDPADLKLLLKDLPIPDLGGGRAPLPADPPVLRLWFADPHAKDADLSTVAFTDDAGRSVAGGTAGMSFVVSTELERGPGAAGDWWSVNVPLSARPTTADATLVYYGPWGPPQPLTTAEAQQVPGLPGQAPVRVKVAYGDGSASIGLTYDAAGPTPVTYDCVGLTNFHTRAYSNGTDHQLTDGRTLQRFFYDVGRQRLIGFELRQRTGRRVTYRHVPLAATSGRPEPALEQPMSTVPPVVVATVPAAGATDVPSGSAELRVTFDRPMADGGWSWVSKAGDLYEDGERRPEYLPDGRTCVLPVFLEPDTAYAVWVNHAGPNQHFTDVTGRPAVPFLLTFHTRPAERNR